MAAAMKPRVKNLLFALVPAGALLLLAAGAELLVRWRLKRLPDIVRQSGLEHPPYFLNASIASRPRLFGCPLWVKTNREGFRGPELTPGSRRILLLGDSVAHGVLVNEQDTVSSLLSKRLSKATGETWEVLNGGTSSYNAWDYEPYLRHRGLAGKPEAVILLLSRNDHVPRLASERSPAQQGWTPPRNAASRLKDFASRSEIFKGLLDRLNRSRGAKYRLLGDRRPLTAEQHNLIDEKFPGDARSAAAIKDFIRAYRLDAMQVIQTLPLLLDMSGWSAVREPLKKLKASCDKNGLPLLVVLYPTQMEVYPGYGWAQPRAALMKMLSGLGIPALDFWRILSGTERGDEYFPMHGDFWHPGREGYELTAESLFYKVEELGWLKRRPKTPGLGTKP